MIKKACKYDILNLMIKAKVLKSVPEEGPKNNKPIEFKRNKFLNSLQPIRCAKIPRQIVRTNGNPIKGECCNQLELFRSDC